MAKKTEIIYSEKSRCSDYLTYSLQDLLKALLLIILFLIPPIIAFLVLFNFNFLVRLVAFLTISSILFLCYKKKIKHTFWEIGYEWGCIRNWFKWKLCISHLVITDKEIYGEKYSDGPSFHVGNSIEKYEANRKLKLVPFKYKLEDISHVEFRTECTVEEKEEEFAPPIYKLYFDNGDMIDLYGTLHCNIYNKPELFCFFLQHCKKMTNNEKHKSEEVYKRSYDSYLFRMSQPDLSDMMNKLEKAFIDAHRAQISQQREINSTIDSIVRTAVRDEINKI